MINVNEKNEIEVLNVVPIIRGNRVVKFLTNISIAEIGKVYDKLVYDENTQRGFKMVRKKGEDVQEKIVNKDNIEEMKDKILNGFFDGGMLTWNVRINAMSDSKPFEYDVENNTVIINEKTITIPDSAQRHIALYQLSKFKDFNSDSYFLPLSISFYTLEEEQSLFSEINGNGQKANKTRSLFLSNTSKSKIVKSLIEKSNLKDNVENMLSGVSKKEKLTTFATLYDSLFDRNNGVFKNIEDENLLHLEKWLVKFYNELIDLRKELALVDLEQRQTYSQGSLAGSNVMFYAYAAIAKELQDDKNWRQKLKRINNEYTYGAYQGDLMSLQNPLWHNTICYLNKEGQWRVVDSNRTRNVTKTELEKYFHVGRYGYSE